MEKITEIGAILPRISALRHRRRDVVTNCLLPQSLSEAAACGRLTVAEHKDQIVILEHTETCDRLFLYAPAGERLRLPQTDNPLLAELVFRQGRDPEDLQRMLWEAGMKRRVRCLDLVHVFSGSDRLEELTALRDQYACGYVFSRGCEADMPEIQTLWARTLSPYDYYDMTPLRLAEEIRAGRILCMRGPEGKLAGTGSLDWVNRACVLRHLSVAPECRGKGLGNAIIFQWARYAMVHGAAAMQGWVDAENAASLAAVRKLCAPGRRILEQYVLER